MDKSKESLQWGFVAAATSCSQRCCGIDATTPARLQSPRRRAGNAQHFSERLYPLLKGREQDVIMIVPHDTVNRVMLLHALELAPRAYCLFTPEISADKDPQRDSSLAAHRVRF